MAPARGLTASAAGAAFCACADATGMEHKSPAVPAISVRHAATRNFTISSSPLKTHQDPNMLPKMAGAAEGTGPRPPLISGTAS
jgi:hypothetical protein